MIGGEPSSRRLWSLWDLLKLHSDQFVGLLQYTAQMRVLLMQPLPSVMDEEDWANTRETCNKAAAICEEMGLIMSAKPLRKLAQISRPDAEGWPREHQECFRDAIDRIRDELSSVTLLELDVKDRGFFEPTAPLFGESFANKFPSNGAFELEEAAKCIALGRSTAGVFHLMRLMEIAVKAVARCLSIPDPTQAADRSWGAILPKIRDGIDVKWPTVATRLTGDGAIFDSLYASLDAVKNPWRNSTMHPANKYTLEETEHIFAAVRGFIMKLADRCDENGDPRA